MGFRNRNLGGLLVRYDFWGFVFCYGIRLGQFVLKFIFFWENLGDFEGNFWVGRVNFLSLV